MPGIVSCVTEGHIFDVLKQQNVVHDDEEHDDDDDNDNNDVHDCCKTEKCAERGKKLQHSHMHRCMPLLCPELIGGKNLQGRMLSNISNS